MGLFTPKYAPGSEPEGSKKKTKDSPNPNAKYWNPRTNQAAQEGPRPGESSEAYLRRWNMDEMLKEDEDGCNAMTGNPKHAGKCERPGCRRPTFLDDAFCDKHMHKSGNWLGF